MKILTPTNKLKSKQENSFSWHKLKYAMFGLQILKRKWKSSSNLSKSTLLSQWYSSFFIKDTEFPGIIASRGGEYGQRCYSEEDEEYILIRRNVEETKMIQIGLSIADEKGNVPYPVNTWQFNFKWDKDK